MNTQPEALRLADLLDRDDAAHHEQAAAAELRRLHEVNQELMGALKMAILQNEHDMIMTGEECRKAHAALRQAIEAAEKIENPPIRIQNHTNIEQALSVLQQADPINHKVDVKTAMGILKQTINQEYQGSDAAKAAHMIDLYDKLGVKLGEDPFVVIEKMRKAFEQAEKQEPVAWMDVDGYVIDFDKTELQKDYAFIQPLYTAPQSKPLIALTDEEIADVWANSKRDVFDFVIPFARAIEAKLKEKNT